MIGGRAFMLYVQCSNMLGLHFWLVLIQPHNFHTCLHSASVGRAPLLAGEHAARGTSHSFISSPCRSHQGHLWEGLIPTNIWYHCKAGRWPEFLRRVCQVAEPVLVQHPQRVADTWDPSSVPGNRTEAGRAMTAAFAWTQLPFRGRAVLGREIVEEYDGCWPVESWTWLVPVLTSWENKEMAAAHPGMLKPHWLSAKNIVPFLYKTQMWWWW